MEHRLILLTLLGRCFALTSAAQQFRDQTPSMSDLWPDTIGQGVALLQTMQRKVWLSSPNASDISEEDTDSAADYIRHTIFHLEDTGSAAEAKTKAAVKHPQTGSPRWPISAKTKAALEEENPTYDEPITMADMYQKPFQANDVTNSNTAPFMKYPRAEMTLADAYQNSFQADRYRRLPHHASPTMQRASAWVSGILLSGMTTLAIFGIVSGWSGTALRRDKSGKPPSALLLERCLDVDFVPVGTLCVVCLEEADDACKTKECPKTAAIDDAAAKDSDEAAVKTAAKPVEEQSLEGQLLPVPALEWCRTPCGHCFHRGCLEKWLSTATPARKRCPVCNWS